MNQTLSLALAAALVAAGAGGASGQERGGEASAMREVRVCEVVDGELRETTRMVAPGAETTYSHAPPPPGLEFDYAAYAANKGWYINNEPITFNGRRYVKYGLPRVLGVTEVARAGAYEGVSVFSKGGSMRADVIYIPVRPGCEFQPYQTDVKTGGVRG